MYPIHYRKTLLIGEGNFSFALALVKKHDEKADQAPTKSIANTIVATELGRIPNELWSISHHITTNDLSERINCENCDSLKKEEIEGPIFCDNCLLTVKRIAELEGKGAIIGFGIDGTKMHQIEALKNIKFKRIHWNCPHDDSREQHYNLQTLPPIIARFFQSCAQMQNPHGSVHISLVQPPLKASYYQAYVYDIVNAATSAGYVLVKKNKFGDERYPGYTHTKTRVNIKARVTEGGMREFVFKKIGIEDFDRAKEVVQRSYKQVLVKPLSEQLMKYSEKKFSIETGVFQDLERDYLCCSTDEDSASLEGAES